MAAPDRTRLPLDVDTSARPIRPVEAVPGSPNVVIVLIDDMGFGASSAYGGPCEMPTAQRLADDGLRYSRFHVTSLCSPTRQALMTGRNHHSVGMGVTSEMSTPEPGYHGYRPASAATIAQILSGNGYCTAAVGKWHQTPPVEVSPSGPFQRWPMGEGFDFFYGFMGAEMNHWYPQLYQGRYAVEPDRLARGRLPPVRGPRRQRHLLGREPAGDHPRAALLHLPGARRDARAVPRRGRVARQVRRPVRRRLGRAAGPDPGPSEGARHRAGVRRSWPPGPRACRTGTSSTRPSSASPRGSWRPTPGSPSTPTCRSAGSSTPWRRWASSTTR